MAKKVFAFDLGKASIGYCVREGHDIKEANSIIIDKDHAERVSLRDRRRIKRTIDAHKSREQYLDKVWQDCGQEILDKKDLRFTKEFGRKKDNTIYTSCLLRIALLQDKPLGDWQIYKALHNAIQRRGYDPNVAWATSSDDDENNLKLIEKYTKENGVELITAEEYKYPCYYDAIRLGLWTEDKPTELRRYISTDNITKVRTTNYVAPRLLVEKELSKLWENAQKQIPELQKYSVEEFLYGEYREAYGSLVNPDYRQFMGTPNDWQGVLGQKIPRFDNRIISKCKLLPKRNVCKADTIENVSFVLLMKLKNLRFTDISGEKVKLSPVEIKEIYENWLKKVEKNIEKAKEKNTNKKTGTKLDTTITKDEISKIIGRKIIDKIEPLKANISGRSSFCRRACQIMNKIILTGELYPKKMDISEFVDKPNAINGITEEEIRTMLSRIGDWNNLYIPDNREENAKNASSSRIKTDIMIGNITNPIVRNRLQIFRDLIIDLSEKYGKPDEVIFEFVRDGADNSLFGKIKASKTESYMNAQKKENDKIKEELKNVDALNGKYFLMNKLLKMQGGECAYSGKKIGIADFPNCEIDHIYPRTMGGNDALYNKVVCLREQNQLKKGRTPYEWLSHDEDNWAIYVNRLNKIKNSLGKKKYELLTSKPEDCAKLIESYNGLAETSYIARVAQQMTAFIFGWGLQVEGENRYIYVNNGASTHAIRKRYGLNSFLGDDEKKNRENDKHHALDAICISYSQDFKYNEEQDKDIIEGFNPMRVKEVIDSIIPYPYANKKQFKGNTRPLETIYGLRTIGEKSYIINRVDITSIEQKEKKIKNIRDEIIKNDLLSKLEENMPANDWKTMLENYIHPKKKTRVKKVMLIVSEGELEKDSNGRERVGEFVDFGTKGTKHQFKHSKGQKGRILYYDDKNNIKVMTIYSNQKNKDVNDKLENMGCKLYNNGEIYYTGCLVNIPEDFIGGKNTYKKGIYKISSINGAGQAWLFNASGVQILTSVKYLAQAKFSKYKD